MENKDLGDKISLSWEEELETKLDKLQSFILYFAKSENEYTSNTDYNLTQEIIKKAKENYSPSLINALNEYILKEIKGKDNVFRSKEVTPLTTFLLNYSLEKEKIDIEAKDIEKLIRYINNRKKTLFDREISRVFVNILENGKNNIEIILSSYNDLSKNILDSYLNKSLDKLASPVVTVHDSEKEEVTKYRFIKKKDFSVLDLENEIARELGENTVELIVGNFPKITENKAKELLTNPFLWIDTKNNLCNIAQYYES